MPVTSSAPTREIAPVFSGSDFSERRIAHLALLSLLPLILAVFNENWAFTSSQALFIDPWLYTSFFLHLKAQLLAFPDAYYGDRLSVTLPGWLLYQALGPMLGNYVYKLSVIYAAAFSIYFATSRLFDRRSALLAGLLVLSQPFFLMAFGWDYVDGIGIAYFSLSLLCVFSGAQSESSRNSLVLAGLFCNCLITSHFLWLNLAWIIPVAFVLVNRGHRRHALLPSLAFFSLGFAIAFAAFCAIYYGLVGTWFYFDNSLTHTLNGFGAAQEVNDPVTQWINVAIWTVHFNALTVLVLWRLLRSRAEASERVAFFLFALGYLTVWIWQIVGFPFVMLHFYLSFLFPLYALALAGIVSRPLRALQIRGYLNTIILTAGAFVLVYSTVSFWDSVDGWLRRQLGTIGPWVFAHQMWILSVVCLAVSIPILFAVRQRKWLTPVFVVGLFSVYVLQISLLLEQGWFTSSTHSNKHGFELILKADEWVHERVPDRRLLWWIDRRGPGYGIAGGLTSLFFRGYTILGQDMPVMSAAEAERLSTRSSVLAISSDASMLDKARATLESQHLDVKEDRTTLAVRELRLHLGLFDVKPAASWIRARTTEKGLAEVPGIVTLESIVPAGPWLSFSRDSSIRVVTTGPRWAYLALAPVQFPPDQDAYWVHFRLRVLKGEIGVGILNETETDFYEHKFVNEDEDLQEVVLPITHPRESRKLVIRNAERDGERSEVIIEKVSVYAQALPASQAARGKE